MIPELEVETQHLCLLSVSPPIRAETKYRTVIYRRTFRSSIPQPGPRHPHLIHEIRNMPPI